MLGRLKIFNLRHASSLSILFARRPILSKKKATSFCFSTFSSSSRRKGARWGKDEILAMATWLLVGTGAFVLVGTTTAASFGLLLANSLQFQEFVVGKVAKWLEASLGWKVSFGSGGIVPNWRDGRITLRDVSVCLGDVNRSDLEVPPYEEDVREGENYTRFSVQFDRLDIRISLRRWLEGRGLLEKVFVDGARGVLDKRWIRFIDGWKWKSRPGDFDLNSLELRNVHLSIVQPVGFCSYAVTILSASVPRLRAGWLFYDLLSSDSAHGIFDGRSLFTLHKTQGEEERELRHFRMLGLDVRHLNQGGGGGVGGGNDNSLGWVTRGTVDIEGFYQLPGKRGSRSFEDSNNLADSFNFTPDTLKEKLLLPLLTSSRKKQQGSDCDDCGYFQEYSADLLPLKYLYDSRIRPRIPEKFQEISDKLVSIPSNICDRLIERLINDLKGVDYGGLESAEETAKHFLKAPEDSVAFQVDFLFRNLRAKLPSNDNLLLRPVIGYVNEHRPLIPLSCHFTLKEAQFCGAWSGYESGLIAALTENLEGAFHRLVWDPERRMQRLGKIGRWTLGNYLKSKSTTSV